jgi:hypothetical protein
VARLPAFSPKKFEEYTPVVTPAPVPVNPVEKRFESLTIVIGEVTGVVQVGASVVPAEVRT